MVIFFVNCVISRHEMWDYIPCKGLENKYDQEYILNNAHQSISHFISLCWSHTEILSLSPCGLSIFFTGDVLTDEVGVAAINSSAHVSTKG